MNIGYIQLGNLTADPSSPANGSIWYRTDLGKFRGRENGVSKDLISAGGSLTVTEIEIDFGTSPIKSKRFTITDASVTGSSKIQVEPSGNIATGRIGNDYDWDMLTYAAKGQTGTFILYAFSTGKIVGKRKIFYTVS
jgi:hypothetical protein